MHKTQHLRKQTSGTREKPLTAMCHKYITKEKNNQAKVTKKLIFGYYDNILC